MDPSACLINNFFQFLIGNTDFSVFIRHNQKLYSIGDKVILVPYDFDMSGLVNANYAVVSQIPNQKTKITDVTHRHYRGFRRNPDLVEEVRHTYLDRKDSIMQILEDNRNYYQDPD